ncbi:paraquat-inducible protein B [Kingella potus]|uniref:Paraquat-inducible protein B n=1 Tax=Kingella potus TaxID=265175 RepID=A0A377R1P6_9NEIS|nr:intermembrane transport protein PqiB [Kingella potus]UOP01909.1 intermembrane transport protein PqiB [Kingella potus]STR02667.1 paraquat-inducible protein B [Kingella potus]
MSQPSPVPARSRVRKTNAAASFVWIVPLLAFLVGGWLLFDHIRNTGPKITLYLDSAEGIETNNTVVRVLSVNVGKITNIRLRGDGKGVELTAQLNADVKNMLKTDTQFWVVKPRIDGSGISGLNTLVSGAYIAFIPGKAEQSKDTFEVSDIPPVAALGQDGLRLKLSGSSGKKLDIGAPVVYESLNVGQVESVRFNPQTRRIDYTIFIGHPNDTLINSGSRFWLDSGIRLRTDGGGFQLDSAPLGALISGAIAFSSPDKNAAPAAEGQQFELYGSRAAADSLPDERAIYYTAFFKQSVRGLSSGSPVEYKGLRVGSVADVPYFAAGDSLTLFSDGRIPVRLRIDPYLIERNADRQSREYWQNAFQTALSRGLTAGLAADNLILGSKMIELSDTPAGSTPPAPQAEYAGLPVIATRAGGGLDDLQSQLSALLDKLNKLPLEKTVGELNGSLAELKHTLKSANSLLAKPQTQAVPAELNKTLAELRQTLHGVSPASPVYRDVQDTLRRIDQTLGSVQPLLDTLKEKPNSLIFNQNSKDPVPKGQ